MGFTSVESITYAVFRIYRLLDEELINNSGSPISTRRRSDRLCSTQIISGLVNGQNFRYRSRIFLKNFTGQHSEGLRWRFGVPFIRLVCAVRTSSKHTATVSSNPSFCDTWNLSSAECGRFFFMSVVSTRLCNRTHVVHSVLCENVCRSYCFFAWCHRTAEAEPYQIWARADFSFGAIPEAKRTNTKISEAP